MERHLSPNKRTPSFQVLSTPPQPSPPLCPPRAGGQKLIAEVGQFVGANSPGGSQHPEASDALGKALSRQVSATSHKQVRRQTIKCCIALMLLCLPCR